MKNKVLNDSLKYVTKTLTWFFIAILILIGAFLVYYVVSNFLLRNTDKDVPKITLYTIVSPSMEPVIRTFDVIIVSRIDDVSTIEVGDVITFISTSSHSRDMRITHRVIEIKEVDGKLEFVTKGDNNPTADSDTVKTENVIGKTVMKIPQLGRIQALLSTRMGWLLIVLVPALGVIIYDVVKLFNILKVKDTSEQVKEGKTSFKERKNNQDDKKINEAFEQITKNTEIIEDPPKEEIIEETPVEEKEEIIAEKVEEVVEEPVVEETPEVKEEIIEEQVIEEPTPEPVVEDIPEEVIEEEPPTPEPEIIEEKLVETPEIEDIIKPIEEDISPQIELIEDIRAKLLQKSEKPIEPEIIPDVSVEETPVETPEIEDKTLLPGDLELPAEEEFDIKKIDEMLKNSAKNLKSNKK